MNEGLYAQPEGITVFRRAALVMTESALPLAAGIVARLAAAGMAALSPRTTPRCRDLLPPGIDGRISRSDIIVVPTPVTDVALALGQGSRLAQREHRPVLVLPVSEDDTALDSALLDHVAVLADYASDVSCAHACAIRLVGHGARRVTLRHSHGRRPATAPGRTEGELEWIDFVRVELFKNRLLQAGADTVVFELDETSGFIFADDATIVVLASHCRPEIADAFAARLAVRSSENGRLPGVLLPAGTCCPPDASDGRPVHDGRTLSSIDAWV